MRSAILMGIVTLGLGALAIPVWQAWAAPPRGGVSGAPSGDASSDVMNTQLKNSVIATQKKLAPLDSVQKKIFDEEVVPQFALFVKNYKRVGTALDVELDMDGIRNLIRFSVAKFFSTDGKPGTAKLLLSLDEDTACAKCVNEAPPIRKMMQIRAMRRGFTPLWVGPDELTAGTKLSDLVGPRGAVGYLQVQLQPAPEDDVDTAHAEGMRFITKAEFEIRGVTDFQDQAEIFDTDSFQIETDKLLTHAYTDLGAKSAVVAPVSAQNQEELFIEVTKIANFAQYAKLKSEIQEKLKSIAVFEERKITRGSATFSVKTKISIEGLKTLLKGLSLDATKESVILGSNEHSIQMEIR